MTARLSPNLAGIRCFACETSHDPRQLLTVCRACGLPPRVDYNLSSLKLSLRDLQSREPSLWRYHELLPLVPGDEVSLVEGLTHQTHGEWLLSKVGRVFPVLREEALQASHGAY